MKHLISALVLITGCTAATEGGDDGGGGDDGSGEEPSKFFKATTIHDERFDEIDFASGEPVHTHAGPEVALGSDKCTDVFKHSYLMETPKFGREVTENPIRFALSAKEYRLRRGDEVIADWAPVTGGAVTITRSVLGDREGTYVIEARSGDVTSEACWTHHPLAAPVEIQAAQPDASGLAGMSLLTNSPISKLLDPTIATRVYAQRFVHHTAEPVTLTLDVTIPAAAFARNAIDGFVVSDTGNLGLLCERDSDGYQSGDPICTLPNEVPVTLKSVRSGTLESVTWTMNILDEATGLAAANCDVSGFHATCQLAPRATTEASQAYRIVLSMKNPIELAPAATGPFAEHTIAGLTFTGKRLEVERRCLQFGTSTHVGVTIVTCAKYVDYTRIQALDTAKIMFPAVPITINGKSYDIPAYTWDAGDDDLPGEY
jgi:hypothetical protein